MNQAFLGAVAGESVLSAIWNSFIMITMNTATTRFESLSANVERLYMARLQTRSDWADELYKNHVLIVAEYACIVAERVGADIELAKAAALLHDIADFKMKRHDPRHKDESLHVARELMRECGYTTDDVTIVVDDAIRYHSCQNGQRPKTLEGQVLATADSLAHLKTDFYLFATTELGGRKSLDEIKQWVLEKVDRDLYQKISFDFAREEARRDYEMIRGLYSR